MTLENDPIEDLIGKTQINLYHWSELKILPKRKYLIKSLLDQTALSVIFGASNSGKTFIAIDIACHIAFGWNWSDNKTRQGNVVYIAAEGGLGIEERLDAFRLHYQIKEYANIYVIPSNVCLCKNETAHVELIEKLSSIEDIKLIVIDTLARAMGSNDENSPSDMGSFIKNCDIIRHETKAHVMIIHHSGKDLAKGARGHSSLRAAIDTEIQVSQSNGVIQALVTKQREGKRHDAFIFELKEYEVGKDEDGDAVYSCALNKGGALDLKPRLSGQASHAYRVLLNMILEDGFDRVPKKGMQSQKCVRVDDFKDHFKKSGIAKDNNLDTVNRAFNRAKDKLKSNGYIGEWDQHIWLTDKPDMTGQTFKTVVAGQDRQDTPL